MRRSATGIADRVLVVAPALPPTVGGAEVVADTVTRVLLAHGVCVGVVTGTPDADVRSAVLDNGGPFVHVGRALGADQIAWEYDTFARAEALWRCLAEFEPDVIHVFSHDAAISVALAQPSAPVIGTFSELATEQGGFGATRSRAVYSTTALRYVTAASEIYASIAIKHGFPANRVLRLITGVDTAALAAGSADRGRQVLGLADLTAERPLILCPSRFTARKGQLELVQAICQLPDEAPVLVLAGTVNSGSVDYLRQVRTAVADYGLTQRVRILDGITRVQLPDVLAAADIVVQPSHREGLGLSALEAMASATPLVATQVSGFEEFLRDNENALLVAPRAPEQLAAALRRLLGDPGLAADLVRQARADVQARYGLDSTAADVATVYRTAIAKTGTAG